ncbi:hypothetical protein Bandiella_00315 [Candidatus Bandiella woodruffii]|uniref:Uncharacterized protein n=1 Tax=Candidatus Bandiella euplotis TaxID=1664265 RepID=A0ABZ0UJC2_9RICK|nr:hypothetical protein Bandiella_00315 [Candidatus Bandiella woodruffii]
MLIFLDHGPNFLKSNHHIYPYFIFQRSLYAYFFHPPYSEGKSLQGEPVLNIQNTALMNLLLLCAKPHHVPSLPGK